MNDARASRRNDARRDRVCEWEAHAHTQLTRRVAHSDAELTLGSDEREGDGVRLECNRSASTMVSIAGSGPPSSRPVRTTAASRFGFVVVTSSASGHIGPALLRPHDGSIPLSPEVSQE